MSDIEKQIYAKPEMEVIKLDDSGDSFLTTSGFYIREPFERPTDYDWYTS